MKQNTSIDILIKIAEKHHEINSFSFSMNNWQYKFIKVKMRS